MSFAKPVGPYARGRRQRNIAEWTGKLPDTATMRANLLAVWDACSEQEREDGIGWYAIRADQATQDVVSAAAAVGHSITARQAKGIIAALSPQVGWGANISAAIELVVTGHASVQSEANNAKALRILDGEPVEDVLGGRKVKSFFANLDAPYATGHVTIDRHAISILYGRKLSEAEKKVLERIGPYTVCAAVYRATARKLNLKPHELQAATWVAWRRIHGDDWRDRQSNDF